MGQERAVLTHGEPISSLILSTALAGGDCDFHSIGKKMETEVKVAKPDVGSHLQC